MSLVLLSENKAVTVAGVIVTWNPAAERIFGYSPKEVHGMPLQTLVAADRREEIPKMLDAIRRGTVKDALEAAVKVLRTWDFRPAVITYSGNDVSSTDEV